MAGKRPPEALAPPRLGALESAVMDVLWSRGESSVREIIAALDTDPAYTTIATVLSHLGDKQLVLARRDGRAARYSARVRREELTTAMLAQVLDSSPDRRATILHFVDSMSEEDLDLLRRHLGGGKGSA